MQKELNGRKMRQGQRLTVAEYKAILEHPETVAMDETITYRGVTITGKCRGCGFDVRKNFGCPKCHG